MHEAAFRFVERCVAFHGPWTSVVDVGGRDINGTPRPLFGGAAYMCVDRVAGEGVDVVADALSWRPEAAPDAVVCCEVLEHVPDPDGFLARLAGWLDPAGVLIVTCAGPGRAPHSGFDGGAVRRGEHYANVHPKLALLAVPPEFELVEYSTPPGDVHLCWQHRGMW